KGTPYAPSFPSHDAKPGLPIPKQDGSKHTPSDALKIPPKAIPGSDSSTPEQSSVPTVPIKKGKGTPSAPSSPSHDAIPGLPIPKRNLPHNVP
ncbi:conserved hypothetical protein, partial [Trichinella spiralis]|uniref:hypothetical protein n=1 Tax=Trichinella spiralis TaxID=6334 RepID=UPI0001EFDED2